MFLKKTYSKNHTYLSLTETYREDGKVKHRTIAQLGRLDILQANDQLKRLTESFARLCQQKKKFSIDDFEELTRVNWGAEKIYRSLWDRFEFEKIFSNTFMGRKNTFPISETVFLEVISRLIRPCSKLRLHGTQENYHGINESSLHHLYRALDLLSDGKEAIEQAVFEKNKSLFNSSVDIVFYDVSTLYFESVKADDLRDFGYSKDCKFGEVQVVFGLLVDTEGRPIGFEIFKGNTFEAKTLCQALEALKKRFQIRDVIIVADRGINSKNNLKLIKESGFDYIVGSRLRSMKTRVKNNVSNKDNYRLLFKNEERTTLSYSFSYTNEIRYKDEDGKWQEEKLDEKLHCTWDSKRAEKDAKDRDRLIEKAKTIIESGGDGSNKRGAKKYIKSNKDRSQSTFDEKKVIEDQKWDGFYGMQTSKKDMSTAEVMDAYRRLWKIEESFRILKSSLQARPMFHWSEKRIKGHLVVCFIAFLLQRTLELLLIENKYDHTPDKVRSAIDKMELSVVKIENQEMFLCSKLSGLSSDILKALKIPTPKKLSLPEQF